MSARYQRAEPAAPGRLTPPGAPAATGAARIRPCRLEDIPAIVALRRRTFQSAEHGEPADLAAYCERVLFYNPWRDEALPSLAYENADGQLAGFIGVIPRRMVFRGEPIRVAVATQMMVAPEARGLAGRQLVRALLDGPQDLTFSDTANEAARRVWKSVGAEEALLYGFTWERVLRPLQHARAAIDPSRRALRLMARATRPLLDAADAISVRFGPHRVPRPPATLERLDAATMVGAADAMFGEYPLHPAYDLASLAWLLREAADKHALGSLAGGVVRNAAGAVAGWFAHYVTPRGTSHVLGFAARRNEHALVAHHLLYDARRRGAAVVSGRFDATVMPLLETPGFRLRRRPPWTLVHSRRPELLKAINRGDACLSRLAGEWWLSF